MQDQTTDIVRSEQAPTLAPFNPFATQGAEHINAGAVQIESTRAVAEAQGKLLIAKRFPRDPMRAYAEIMQSCGRKVVAERAIYNYPRGKETVRGASIYLVKEMARLWGNIEYGFRELSQRDGESEMEAYAWDLETNVRESIAFPLKHIRKTRERTYTLDDPRDVYELTANMGARRMRACILSLLPPDLVHDAEQACRKTMLGDNTETMDEKLKKLVRGFAQVGIKPEHLESRLQRDLSTMTPEEYVEFGAIFNSIREHDTNAGEWFPSLRKAHASDEARAMTEALKGSPKTEHAAQSGTTNLLGVED